MNHKVRDEYNVLKVNKGCIVLQENTQSVS